MLLHHLWKDRLSWHKAKRYSQPVVIALGQQGEFVLDQQNKQKRAEVTKFLRRVTLPCGELSSPWHYFIQNTDRDSS